MKTRKKRKKYKHRSTFVPKYLSIPATVVKDYRAGASILELTFKYKRNGVDIRKRLVNLGVTIRRPGTCLGISPKQKLNREQIQQILALDEQNISHMELGKRFRITRERIRQICLKAGHATRRSRMDKSIQRKEIVIARKLERFKKIEQIAKAWRQGAHSDELAILIWGEIRNPGKTHSKISVLRKYYGLKMFPRRRSLHWTQLTQLQRNLRLLAMSKEWIKTANYKHIQKMFGYRSVESVTRSIYMRRKRYPDLFPTISEIVKQKDNERNK